MKLSGDRKPIFLGTLVGGVVFAVPALLATFVPIEERVLFITSGALSALLSGLIVVVVARSHLVEKRPAEQAIVFGPVLGLLAFGVYSESVGIVSLPEYVPYRLYMLLVFICLNLIGSMTIYTCAWLLRTIRQRG